MRIQRIESSVGSGLLRPFIACNRCIMRHLKRVSAKSTCPVPYPASDPGGSWPPPLFVFAVALGPNLFALAVAAVPLFDEEVPGWTILFHPARIFCLIRLRCELPCGWLLPAAGVTGGGGGGRGWRFGRITSNPSALLLALLLWDRALCAVAFLDRRGYEVPIG